MRAERVLDQKTTSVNSVEIVTLAASSVHLVSGIRRGWCQSVSAGAALE
jgi:hypothetical protein